MLAVTNCSNIDFLEHVVANVSFVYGVRGQIKMTLISPSGTPSEILSFRKNDKNSKGFFLIFFKIEYKFQDF